MGAQDRIKDNVRELLKQDFKQQGEWRRRDSYNRLVVDYWMRYCGVQLTGPQVRQIERAASAETVMRRRREMREDFPPSEKVDKILEGRYREETERQSPDAYSWLRDV